MKLPQLLDARGRPVHRDALTSEVSAATLGGVRSPISGYPADGLNPLRLANILREADQGDPVRYLELAETIEERDPHYLGVLGTRRRSVSQITVSVEAASDDPVDIKIADMIRDWLARDELTEEIFDILDCIGKGYSFTEIIWDTSEGQWLPARLEWRDPRWFRFDRRDLASPMQVSDTGEEVPLEPFKFISAQIKAKSGLALRSGLARVATWGWMFKAYTQRDWAIFTQTYGQPLRLGRFQNGASEEDKATLFRAVANIAGDCAAIIPEGMSIDFVEAGNVGQAADLYLNRANWLDQQISKAVLGQTATTDAVVGGLGSGKEHREVQKDIETADARALAAILNRDLIRPWVQLEYGPRRRYPRLRIERAEQQDLKALAEALGPMIDRGLEVEQSVIRDRFGLAEPASGAKLLRPARDGAPVSLDLTADRAIKRENGDFKRGAASDGPLAPQSEQGRPVASSAAVDHQATLTEALASEATPEIDDMMATIEAMLRSAGSLGEFREMLLAGFPDIDASRLAQVIGRALVAANVAGRAAVEQEDA